MPRPDLLREAVRELLYGPPVLRGLYLERAEGGVLGAVHALDAAGARAVAAGGRSAAALSLELAQTLDLGAARLADPHALLSDERDPATWTPRTDAEWRAHLVALARAGEGFYEALYRPLDADAEREALGTLLRAVWLTSALRAQGRAG